MKHDDIRDEYLELEEFLAKYEVSPQALSGKMVNTDAPYDPNYIPEHNFPGNMKPVDRAYWEKVFSAVSLGEDVEDMRISIEQAKEGMEQGMAQRDLKEKSIRAGLKSGQLYVIDGGLLLANGWDRPKAILPDQLIQKYTERNYWADLYAKAPPEPPIPKRVLVGATGSTTTFDESPLDHIDWARAAIQIAIQRNTLIPTEDGDNPPLKLCAPDVPEKWKSIWKIRGKDTDEPFAPVELSSFIPGQVDKVDNFEEAKRHIRNCVYRTQSLQETSDGNVKMVPRGEGGPHEHGSIPAPKDSSPTGDNPTPDEVNEPSETEPPTKKAEAAAESEVSAADTETTSPDTEEPQTEPETNPEADSDIPAETERDANSDGDDTKRPDDQADWDGTPADSQSETAADTTETTPPDDTQTTTTPSNIGQSTQTDPDTDWYSEWDITPTDHAPDGWLEAYAAAIDAYHDQIETTIDANVQWNALFDTVAETHFENGVCHSDTHDSYSPNCHDCELRAPCSDCDTDDAPIVAVTFEGCSESHSTEDTLPDSDCDSCSISLHCAGCAAEADRKPVADCTVDDDGTVIAPTTDTSPPTRRPLVYTEQIICDWTDDSGDPLHTSAADGIADDRNCDCAEHTYHAPVQRLPETPRDYYTGPQGWQDNTTNVDTDPNPDGDATTDTDVGHPADLPTPRDRYTSDANKLGRQLSPDLVDDLRLGYAPQRDAPWEKPVATELLDDGYTIEQLLATGLFQIDRRWISYKFAKALPDDYDQSVTRRFNAKDLSVVDLQATIDDDNHPLEAIDVIKPCWEGRYLFPYFIPAESLEMLTDLDDHFEFPFDVNALSEADIEAAAIESSDPETPPRIPIYAISRCQPQRPLPGDYRTNAKYDKLKTSHLGDDIEYVYADEPIFGLPRIQQNESLIITEGMMDAITAIDHGLPALSPVTTKFKDEHHDQLADLVDAFDINGVWLIQDNEPSDFALLDDGNLDEATQQDVEETLASYDRILDSQNSDLPEAIETRKENADSQRGPIANALTVNPISPGQFGALKTGSHLVRENISTYHVDLPAIATDKIDLDDYLAMNISDHLPLFPGLQALRETMTDAERAALAQTVFESGQFGHHYLKGQTAYLEELTGGSPTDADEASPTETFADWQTIRSLGQQVPVTLDADGQPTIHPAATSNADSDQTDDDMASPADDRLPKTSGAEWTLQKHVPQQVLLEAALDAQSDADTDADTTPTDDLSKLLERLLDTDAPFDNLDIGATGQLLTLGSPVAGLADATDTTPAYTPPRGTSIVRQTSEDSDAEDTHADQAGRPTLLESTPPTGEYATRPALFDAPRICQPRDHPEVRYIVQRQKQRLADIASDTADQDASHTGGNSGSDLWDVTLRDATGLRPPFRGKNPQGHTGNSEDYFWMTEDDFAYDFKRDAVFNGLFNLLVDADARPLESPEGQLEPDEYLAAWLEAKSQNLIPSDDSIPNAALNAAAVEQGVADWSDIGPKTIHSNDGLFTIDEALPDEQYNEILEIFEDEYGESPGREPKITKATFEVEGLTTEESPREFAQRYLTTDVPEEEYLREGYSYPRTPTVIVWKVYKFWCEEINGVDHKTQNSGGKKEIANIHKVERGTAWFGSKRRQCYRHLKFNDSGWNIHNLMQRDSEPQADTTDE